jgi:hypothetical protein
MTGRTVTPETAPDLPRDAIGSPRARSLFDWWDACRAGKRMPARGDFASEDIARWWPDLILYDVEPGADGGHRFRFRVHGTNAVQADGVDYTGRYLADVMPGEYARTILDCYEEMIRRDRPLYSTGYRVMRSRLRMNFERLLLPLGDGRITHILALLLWRLPKENAEIDPLALENLPFVNDVLGFLSV